MNHPNDIALAAYLETAYGIKVSIRHAIHRAYRFATLAEMDGDTAAATDLRRAAAIAEAA